MLALVSDLIDYAKGTSGQTLLVAPVYFHGVLDSVVMEAQVLALRRNNKFSFDLSGAVPPVVEVDAKRLRQVLINLLDNAAKFTRDGMIGLKVRATDTPGKASCVDLHFACTTPALASPKKTCRTCLRLSFAATPTKWRAVDWAWPSSITGWG